ncbi:MAG: hypothetical protein SO375_05310 [Prevotella sp.]|nr:hypothetical protein [Prevotella sp.]
MELLRYYDQFPTTIIVIGVTHRENSSVSFPVKNYIPWRNTSFEKRVPHALDLIDTVKAVVITAYEDLLYLSCMIQAGCRVNSAFKEHVPPMADARLRSSTKKQSDRIPLRNSLNFIKQPAIGIANDQLVANQQ